jgi:hypothetical protein
MGFQVFPQPSSSAKVYGINVTSRAASYSIPDGVYSYTTDYFVSLNGAIRSSSSGVFKGTTISSVDNFNIFTTSNPVLNTNINAITQGNGYFVVGGAASTIAVSTDTINWTTRSSQFGATSTIRAMAFGNNTYVAVGNNGTITSSTNTVNWTSRNANLATQNISAITFGGGYFVACSGAHGITTSTDGITWTTRTSPPTNATYQAVTYGNGYYLVAQSGGVEGMIASTNITTWTTRTVPLAGGDIIYAMAFGNNLFIAAGASGKMMTSTDSINWTTRNSGTTAQINTLNYGNNFWVYGAGVGIFAISTNGTTWTLKDTGVNSNINGSLFHNDTFYIVGNTNRFQSTYTGPYSIYLAASTDNVSI